MHTPGSWKWLIWNCIDFGTKREWDTDTIRKSENSRVLQIRDRLIEGETERQGDRYTRDRKKC
jgi:hypothetical protein